MAASSYIFLLYYCKRMPAGGSGSYTTHRFDSHLAMLLTGFQDLVLRHWCRHQMPAAWMTICISV